MKFPYSLISLLCLMASGLSAAPGSAPAQSPALADVETQKCMDKIASVQRDVLGKYDDALQDLLSGFQKAADLESSLAVRDERRRLSTDSSLTEKDVVNEPKALHALQAQTVARLRELVSQLIQESVPRLVEIKKSLTVAGKLDEAVAVRTAIEQLQNSFSPAAKVESGSSVPAETLLQAYAADRGRADKQYKGQRILTRGVLGGFRQDPADAKYYLLYITGGAAGSSWVQCAFSATEFHFREEKQFNNSVLIVSWKDEPNGIKLQKGQTIDIRGVCEGWDELVKMAKCDFPK